MALHIFNQIRWANTYLFTIVVCRWGSSVSLKDVGDIGVEFPIPNQRVIGEEEAFKQGTLRHPDRAELVPRQGMHECPEIVYRKKNLLYSIYFV